MIGFRRGLRAATITFVVATAAAMTAAVAQPVAVTLGTASVGGTYVVYGGFVADLLADKAGIQVTPRQTQGPNQNVILVDEKKIELGMTTMGVALQALQGSAAWTKGKKFENIRALFPMYDTPLQCVALKKSGIASFRQLAGKTVGAGPKAGTAGTYFPLIFEALGMKAELRYGQGDDVGNQLGDGIVDAFCFGAGAPVPVFSQLDAQKDVVFFTWTDPDLVAIRSKIPEFSGSTIAKRTYRQQTTDQKTIGLYNFAIAHKDMSDDLAYVITKTVLENNARLAKGHPAGRETIAANAARNSFLPFHPGAVRYYKEKGVKLDPATLVK
ncbi:TAXI family TRAP transporter solute-binding subunit [Reyranella sp.]|uniref:TAXI family TRAP transporter solute-binding subunit n=1 Tax=Reyranella sp. TaxID=1929291 RepID=UPI00273117D4|nr:TAXI family TRAP transporter solute-binding subunit [Reyranella sp.]MDP2374150.1 TAXI family TRAP transporter solute-binding subunit [Reyranella sp.]